MANENNDSESLTPLQRYLAKHKDSGADTPKEEKPKHPPSDEEARAIEAGAPAMPPPLESSFQNESARKTDSKAESSSVLLEPGRFGVRALAYIVDLIIISVLTSVADFTLGMGLFFIPDLFWFGLAKVVNFAVIFVYYGWFYSERGATPGKMLFDLEVMETGSGRRIGYWRSFFRETVGKFLSGLVFGVGYLLVLFREDRKALHDLIFDTRVMRKREPRA